MIDLKEKVKNAVYIMMNDPNGASPNDIAEEIVPLILDEVNKAALKELFFKSCTCSFDVERVIRKMKEQ